MDYRLFSSLPESDRHRVWAEIDLDALRNNFCALRNMIQAKSPLTRAIAVVKADAYGHGSPACVKALLDEGCDFFAVASVEEAVAVRKACDEKRKDATILILGYTYPEYAGELAAFRLTQTVLSLTYAEALQKEAQKAGATLSVHVVADSGMNRIGFACRSEEEIRRSAEEIREVCALPSLRVDGMFTHFARADAYGTPDGRAFTDLQFSRYVALKTKLEEMGVKIPFHHVCNSAAAVFGKEELLDGVRLGILLYGASPEIQNGISLTPVMKLKTIVSHLHTLPAGESVGYGGDFCADSERLIATLPIGYADGFLRDYKGASVQILHDGARYSAKLVGRICMDQCMADVTGLPVEEGDEVVLFGDTPDALSALADQADTIDYESLCLISARVPRRYINQ